MLARFALQFVNRYGTGLLVYGGVAVVSALTEWGSFLLMLQALGPITAAITAFFISTTINWLLSRAIAFRSMRRLGTEFMLVFAMSALAFGANFVAFLVLFQQFGIDVLISKVVATFFGFGFNYLARQFFIFSSIPLYSSIRSAFKRPVRLDVNGDVIRRVP